MRPPFTNPYEDEDGSQHSGDYTAVDGTKLDGSNRRDYESTFDNLWSLLAPGGRCVVVDVFTDKLTLVGRWVELSLRRGERFL